MIKLILVFAHDETGAVSVDWVVITAAVLGLCVIFMTALSLTVGNRIELMNISIVQADEHSLGG